MAKQVFGVLGDIGSDGTGFTIAAPYVIVTDDTASESASVTVGPFGLDASTDVILEAVAQAIRDAEADQTLLILMTNAGATHVMQPARDRYRTR